MNIRVIVSDRPGVVLAEDHRDIGDIGQMKDDELGAWVRETVIRALTRGPIVQKPRGSS